MKISPPLRRLLLCLGMVIALTAHSATNKPNIIFVLFDDVGYGQPQSYNPDSKLRMPNFDQLTKEGMRFTDAHTASSVCTPSRYALLTGQYPWRIGQFGVLTSYDKPIIPTTRLTVASLLKNNGYNTAIIGKWHLGLNWVNPPTGKTAEPPIGLKANDGPNALGFDYFYGYTHARDMGTIIEQDKVVEHMEAVDNQPRMIAKALEWIDAQNADKPFFLYFPACPAHTPIIPSDEFKGKSGAVDVVKNDPLYGDWLYQGDDMVGQIMKKLDQKGFSNNTILIVSADNGAASRAYKPLRDSKASIYEGGHRVPFVARWPGKIQAGSICDTPVSLTDFMATVAQIIDVKIPNDAGEDSITMLPLMLGQPGAPRDGVVQQSAKGDLALRRGDWKLIVLKDGTRELFHLGNDIGEKTNLYTTNPEVAAEKTKVLQQLIDQGRSTPGESTPSKYKLPADSDDGGKKSKKK